MNLVAEVVVLDPEIHGPARADLAGLAQQFQRIGALDPHQVQVLDLLRPVDLVQRERRAGGEVLLLVEAQIPDLGLEREGDPGQPPRDLEGVDGFGVFVELEVVDLLRRRHAVVVHRRDDQRGLLEDRQRHLLAVQRQGGPDDDLGLGAFEQGLAVNVDARLQLVVLRLVGELVEAGQRSGGDDDLLRDGPGAERHGDRAVVAVGLVLVPGQVDRRVADLAVGVVEDREDVPRRARAGQETQLALSHQRPAGPPVADVLDHVRARLVKFGELERPRHAADRGLGVLDDLLAVGHQAVELDVGVDLAPVGAIVVHRVDLEDLDDQRLDVLDVQAEGDRLFDAEQLLVGEGEVQVHALVEGLEVARMFGVPLLGIAQAQNGLGFGEHGAEVRVAHVRLVGRVGLLRREEMHQVAADQRLVVARRRQERVAAVVGAEVYPVAAPRLVIDVVAPRIDGVARQGDVGHEAVLVVLAQRPVVHEALVEHVGLQRVVRRGQPAGECPQAVEIRLAGLDVVLEVHVPARAELGEVRVDEVVLVQQVVLELEAFLELRQ